MSAPPQLYIELADDEFDYETDWKEYIGNQSPVSSHFTSNEQSTTLTGWIPCNKKRSALKFFLGYSYALDEAPYSLCRELPARHPVFPNLYAYDAAFTDVAPQAGDHVDVQGTWEESPFEGSKDETMYFANYQKTLMTVMYRSFGRMRFLPDSDIADYTEEYKRFTTFSTDPSVEALTADGSSQLIFREGSGTSPNKHPDPDVTSFPVPVAELMGKIALTIRWMAVPHNYLSTDPDICLLDKIVGKYSTGDTTANYADWKYPPILGTVNKDFFLGYYPGTLLLRAVKVEEMMYPVTTADPFDVAGGYNLVFVMEHFDPIRGEPYVGIPNDPTNYASYRGHRIFPDRYSGYWYAATRQYDTAGMLPLTNFYNIFQSVLDV